MSGGKDARGEDVRGEEREPQGPGAEESTSEPAPGGGQREPEGDEREPEEREPREEGPREEETGGREADVRTAGERGPGEGSAGEPASEVPASEDASPSDGPGPSGGSGLRVLRGLVSPSGQQSKQSHPGNGTVNDANAGPDGPGPDRLGPDELELRSLLHSSVRVVEPSEGSLDYLRRAVPARRARKRQILVGAAAAALFVGTAVPALVHLTDSTGPDANPSAVGHASQAPGGTGEGEGPGGGETTAGGTSDRVEGDRKDDAKDEEKATGTGAGTGVTEGAAPSASATAGSPVCTGAQLGPAVASSGAPDSTGAVYGSFRVANVSTAGCTVGGPGSLGVTPLGAADAAEVAPVRHTAGDAAAGLPDPSLEAGRLVLEPGEAYDVKFAWVPSEPCPTNGGGGDNGGSGGSGGSVDPSPDPSPSENPTAADGTSTGGDTGAETQLLTEDGTTGGSVTVTYTPEGGAGTATATVPNACAGTVYWTGLLPTTAG
ncbi:hypothetical protein [Streptomyces sp. NEAU-W12]|uniref:hypothetical protein n=1 Tax=Streptomyces sp. NEAU-W12 TaxID=2994668 RepID=UPI00224B6049|nr:hypothetical protein [Streptomyces sp. NEAU-W12]MCX2922422.1 hypothetical protein [Streptomyces sp. NEAU-W12]